MNVFLSYSMETSFKQDNGLTHVSFGNTIMQMPNHITTQEDLNEVEIKIADQLYEDLEIEYIVSIISWQTLRDY